MLPKENRLTKKKDFEGVFKKGKGFNEGFLFLKIEKNNLEKSRFAFIVSKKINKKAVDRNKIKRRLREVVRKSLPRINPGIDGVFVVQRDVKDKEFSEIKKTTIEILKKAKVLDD